MAIHYLIDTNVVVHLLLGRVRGPLPLDSNYAVSVVTKIELLGVPNLPGTEEARRRAFVASAAIITPNADMVETAIALRRSRNLRLADSIIAATAVELNAILLTNDAELLRALGPMAQAVPLLQGP